jgi:glutamate dehydrogenase
VPTTSAGSSPVLVYLPRDRYTTEVRLRLEQILREALDSDSVDYTARVSESVLARLHFVVRMKPGQLIPTSTRPTSSSDCPVPPAPGPTTSPRRSSRRRGGGRGPAAARLAGPVPRGLQGGLPGAYGVADLRRVDALTEDAALSMSLYTPYDAGPGERRFKIYRKTRISLSEVLPVLQRLGVEVVDERPYELLGAQGRRAWVYDFGLRYEPSGDVSAEGVKELFQDAFRAVWAGLAESDGFNALVLRGGLTWQQASVLRAYAKYMRQGGSTFSQDYIESALLSNVRIARLLVRLFEARPAPGVRQRPGRRRRRRLEEISSGLDGVASLDQDRILRSYLTMIRATLRSSYFQEGDDGQAQAVPRAEAGPAAHPGPAAAATDVRDLRLLAAVRGRAPALRPGRRGRPALVRPPRGLPHRGARAGQGADGEERRDRAGRRQGRLRAQAAACAHG